MVYSSVGYCKCGHEIWIEYLQAGKAWRTVFSDDQHTEIDHCPQCGRVLEEDDLESK
jgi:hypothetical protein